MATTFIRVPQTGAAPEDYLVSGAASIDLLSAAANFDGSGAGADFRPAVQVLDESGQVVATALGSTVVAGDSASVTFAPFLREAASSSGSGITEITSADATITVTNPFGPITDLSGNSPPTDAEQFDTFLSTIAGGGGSGNLKWVQLGGSAILDLTNPFIPKVKVAGIYSFTGSVISANPVGAGAVVEALLTITGPPSGGGGLGVFVGTGGLNAGMGVNATFYCRTTDTLRLQAANGDGVANDFGIGSMWVQRIT